MTAPTGTVYALLGAAIAVWIAFSFGVQALVSRYGSAAR
jgi:hypothetical protein